MWPQVKRSPQEVLVTEDESPQAERVDATVPKGFYEMSEEDQLAFARDLIARMGSKKQ